MIQQAQSAWKYKTKEVVSSLRTDILSLLVGTLTAFTAAAEGWAETV